MINQKTFRQLALSFPDAVELPHFEKTSFRVNKKIFATLDTATSRVCVTLTEIDQSVFSAYDKSIIYPIPNKWGKMGWTFIELKKVRKSVLQDALKLSYAKVTTKKIKTKSPAK